MRYRAIGSIGIAVTMAAVAASVGPARVSASGPPPPTYYVSLGDSLAQGVQPDNTGANQVTLNGYPDQLYAAVQPRFKNLQMVKLGCPGETSSSMIDGTSNPIDVACGYSAGAAQLDAAEAFLAAHVGKVSFVTIDIGANNVDGCIVGGVIVPACIVAGITALVNDLPVILSGLEAADPGVSIRGMTYYDPFLAAWLTGPAGQLLAQQSVVLTGVFNGDLKTIYRAFSARVVDVASTFQTNNFTIDPAFGIPINVENICAWTYMCAPTPVGPNIHATTPGYSAIAGTFAAGIRPNKA